MNIKRLIEIVHDSFPRNERITKKQVSTILERLLDTISDEIIKENTVNLY
ncbi:hypothetical protein GW796_00395 [archaeon]|nr:hypothetical protein [archaeon]